MVVSARPSLSGLRKSDHGPRASLSPGAEAVSRDCLSRVVVQGAPGCSSPGPSAVPRGGRAPHQLATPSPLSCNGTYNQNGSREVETQSANTLVSFGFCDVKLSEKREDSFVSESITCGVARVRDQQEELRWDAADVIMDSPDGNVLLPLVSGGVSRPKRDPGTRPNWGFSGRTPSPHLFAPSSSCEIPLERVGDQSAGQSKVAGTSCIAVISFQVFGPGSALGTKGTWTDLRRKLLKPQQRFYVIALLLRGPCFEKSVCCSVFFNGRLVTRQWLTHARMCFLALFPSQNIVKTNSKYLFSGAWKGRDKERTDLQC